MSPTTPFCRNGFREQDWVLMLIPLIWFTSAPVKAETADFPVMIRVSERVLGIDPSSIQYETDVDTCILGIRNIGTANIEAILTSHFVPARYHAALQVRVRGHFTARTRGSKGPATVHSHSRMFFDFIVPIEIDEATGLRMASPKGSVQPVSADRRISTQLPGIRGRVVKRLAHRRMQQSRQQAEAISIANAHQRLTEQIAEQVKSKVDNANESLTPIRSSLIGQAWYGESPRLRFKSDNGHLIIYFPDPSATNPAPEPTHIGLIHTDPAPVDSKAVGQIFVHQEWLDQHTESKALADYITSFPLLLTTSLSLTTDLTVRSQDHSPWQVYSIYSDDALEPSRKIERDRVITPTQ